MTDPGLNQRLRQRSRRSGLMIGFSMLLTLMMCVGAFTVIYARLEPVVADFVGRGDAVVRTPVPTEEPVAQEEPTTEPAEEEPAETEPAAEATQPPDDGGDNQADAEEEDPDAFEPDYQIDSTQPVNLRPGPGVATGDALIAMPVASPLMYLDEQEPTTDPERDQMEEGQVWMRFRTEDGTEGWIRELDVTEYEP